MNDKLLMENYLLILKSTIEVYIHGTLESSNQEPRNILKECLDETIISQAKTYNEMEKNGWYPQNNIKKEEIEKTITKLKENN